MQLESLVLMCVNDASCFRILLIRFLSFTPEIIALSTLNMFNILEIASIL